MTQPATPVPQTFVLNYCAGALGTSTKVRRVVVISLLVYAIILSVITLLTLIGTIYVAVFFYNEALWVTSYMPGRAGFHVPYSAAAIEYMLDHLLDFPGTYVSLIGLISGPLTWVAWHSFRRQRPCCVMAILGVIPGLVGTLCLTAGLIGMALFIGLRYFSPDAAPAALFLLIPGVLCLLLTLLLWDLITCLRWIAHNPVTEMSPRPFV
ncbi:MAG: hypothetical protein WCI73_14730 [Phycisphaerae bacterium]